jgi:hypothetical protein
MSNGWRRSFGFLLRPAGDFLLGDLAHRLIDRNGGGPRGLVRRFRMLETRALLLRKRPQIASGVLLQPGLRIIRQGKTQALILSGGGEQPKDGERQDDDRS